MGDEDDDGANFEDRILGLVLDALAGKDVKEARACRESIEAAQSNSSGRKRTSTNARQQRR